jgi:hypothetical protein
MKRIAEVALLVAAGFLTVGSAMAQNHEVQANIPFSFNLNGQTLPAGHYTIKSDSGSPQILRLDDRKDSVYTVVMARPDANKSQQNNTIEFHRYGNQYFLSSVRSTDASMDCHLITSKQEKWAKASSMQPVASLRTNDDVLIALK